MNGGGERLVVDEGSEEKDRHGDTSNGHDAIRVSHAYVIAMADDEASGK